MKLQYSLCATMSRYVSVTCCTLASARRMSPLCSHVICNGECWQSAIEFVRRHADRCVQYETKAAQVTKQLHACMHAAVCEFRSKCAHAVPCRLHRNTFGHRPRRRDACERRVGTATWRANSGGPAQHGSPIPAVQRNMAHQFRRSSALPGVIASA